MAKMYQVPGAVASTSGTSALHVALATWNPDPGSEIITTPVTDMGSIIPILACNCILDITDTHGPSFSRAFRLHHAGIRRDLSSLYRNLQESGGMSVSQVGGAKITAMDGRKLLKVGMDLLGSNPRALLDAQRESKSLTGFPNE